MGLRLRSLFVISILASSLTLFAQSSPSQEFEQTRAMPATGRVFVRNVYGNVRVAAWDRPEIKIVSVKHGPTSASLSNVELVVQNQPNRLCIASKYGSGRTVKEWFGFAADPCGDPPRIDGNRADLATVDYAISLPRRVDLVVFSAEGDVEIQGLSGDLFVDINKGHLNAVDVSGNCRLFGSFSGVNVTLNTLPAETHIESAVGPLVVKVAPSLSARVRARSSGKIVQNDFGWPVDKGQELQASLGDGKTLLDVISHSGRVEIRKLTPPQPAPNPQKPSPPARRKSR